VALVVLGLTLALHGTARPQEKGGDGVTLRVVNYAGLAEEILKNRGKVVVVDFWTNDCLPCRKALPHLVELYNAHKKDGLTAITVALDATWSPPLDPEIQGKMQKFLQSKGAVFTNLMLDDQKKLVDEKLRITTVPCLFVFSRGGKWTRFSDDNLNKDEKTGKYYEVEALVMKLLKE
jgi:thiol-disulfide isomerase/thioredoxin